MATVALGIGATALATSTSFGFGLAAGGIAATAIGAVGAAVGSYIDNAFLFPALFDEGSREQSFGSIRIASAEEGAPIWRAHGRRVRVPGLLVYSEDSRPVPRTERRGKRREVVEVSHYADLAWMFARCDGGIQAVEQVLFDSVNVYDSREPAVIADPSGSQQLILEYWRRFFSDRLANPPVFEWRMSIYNRPAVGPALTITSIFCVDFDTIRLTFASAHGRAVGSSFLCRITGTWSGPLVNVFQGNEWYYVVASSGTQVEIIGRTVGNEANTFPGEYIGSATNPRARFSLGFPEGQIVDLRALNPNLEPVDLVKNGVEFQSYELEAVRPHEGGGFEAILKLFPPGRGPGVISRTPLQWSPWVEAAPRAVIDRNFPVLPRIIDNFQLVQPRKLFNEDAFENPSEDVDWSFLQSLNAGGLGVEDQLPSPILTELAGEAFAVGYRGSPLLAARDVNLSSTSNRVGNAEAIIRCADIALGDVIVNILKLRGLPAESIDVSDLAGMECDGFAYSGTLEGSQALQPLVLAYDLLGQETAAGLRFFRRESASVVSVDESEWAPITGGAGGVTRLQASIRESDRPVRSLTLSYFDLNQGLESGSVTFVDQTVADGEDRSLNLPLSLTEDAAYGIARRIVRRAKLNTEWVGSLPRYFDYIQESDIVETTIDGSFVRFLVLRADLDSEGRVIVSGIEEPQSVASLSINANPSTGGGPDDTASRRRSSGLDARVITASWRDDRPSWGGYHIAASPYEPGAFDGGVVYRSLDNGISWAIVARIEKPATSGAVTAGSVNILPQAEAQEVSFVFDVESDNPEVGPEVEIQDGFLESTTSSLAAAGERNLALVGSEFVAFERATARRPYSYVVTNIHRGLNGSPTGDHRDADRFVLIDDALVWIPHDETAYDKLHLIKVVAPGQTIDDVPTLEVQVGPNPDHELTVQYDVRGLRAVDIRDGILLEWEQVDGHYLERYEVRRGPFWNGGEVVARTDSNFLTLRNLPPGERTYHVAAQFRGGLYSASVASVTVTPTDPDGAVFAAEAVQTAEPTPGPDPSDPVQWTARGLELDAGDLEGTYTLFPEIDAGAVANWHWSVEVDSYEVDDRVTGDLPALDTGSIEARVWTTIGRPTSKSSPGSTFDIPTDTTEFSTTDARLASYGWRGVYGDRTRVVAEARFDVDGLGTWTGWARFRDGMREAQKMQVRLVFDRINEDHARVVTAIRAAARA